MKIDAVLGLVTFPDLAIGPHLTRQEFLQTAMGRMAREGVVNVGWVTLHVKPEAGVYGSLIFKDDRLIQVTAMMDMASGETEEWSEKVELKRKSQHDAWLKSELGSPPYQYLWGAVDSEFDPRSCSSNIVITFGEYPKQKSWRDKDRRA